MKLFKSKHKKEIAQQIEDGINAETEAMISGILHLSDTSVKEVMIPRIDVDFLPLSITTEALTERIAESGHSRFPVYHESIDNVVGVLYVKDLIKLFKTPEKIVLENIIKKPFFVPESKRIDGLLRDFKHRHVHIAVAVDEYGGVSGIVCMEDIIEEIVGDIQDEFDNEREEILPLTQGQWLCDARVDMDLLSEALQTTFPSEEFETLGGFVFNLFGKIPVKFEKVSWHHFDFIIQDMEGYKIKTVKIIQKKDTELEFGKKMGME